MAPDTLARWQFATTTVYHFVIVPLTIGLGLMVAVMQTLAYRGRGSERGALWDRAARFWGRLMLIGFAIGIVTGIVQEFQFGMNWSQYSRFVGDIFGAPLAMEGLIAFFLESTFLGMWVFGRGILSARQHLATIWLAAIGSTISAYFILAANSFMQHPVGYKIDPVTHVAELSSVWALLSNNTAVMTFLHTLMAAVLTGAAMLLSVSAWHFYRHGRNADVVHFKVAQGACVLIILAAVGAFVTGDQQARIMTSQQPMKMAAAEALWDTQSHAGFSLFAIGDVNHNDNSLDITIPDGLSMLATHSLSGTVQGINQVQAAERAKYGPGNYVPIVGLAYWSFRLMIGFGALAGLVALAFLVQWRRQKLWDSRRFLRLSVWTVALPILANTAGWLFTETARQPWLVYGLLKTASGVSQNVSTRVVAFSLVGFVLLYGVLGVIGARLFMRYARKGPDAPGQDNSLDLYGGDGDQAAEPSALDGDGVLSMAP